jgi:hypothetical protein
MSMNSSQAAQSAAAGVAGGYDGNSLSLKIIIAFFSGLSIYNALELAILIFITFSRYRGLYFWSLLVSSLGLILYALGFVFKFFCAHRQCEMGVRCSLDARLVLDGDWPECGTMVKTPSDRQWRKGGKDSQVH